MDNKEIKKGSKRKITGLVVSDKTEKTITVKVDTKYKHAKYSKFITKSKKFHAHDELNNAKTGDIVTLIESRAHSKTKKWELFSVK